jgi:hypothetical protein
MQIIKKSKEINRLIILITIKKYPIEHNLFDVDKKLTIPRAIASTTLTAIIKLVALLSYN